MIDLTNPLNNVPYNTQRVFIMAKTLDGCEIYMPVDSRNDAYITQQKIKLQNWLDTQYKVPELPPEGPRFA